MTLRELANSRSGYADFLTDKTLLKTLVDDPFYQFTPSQLIRYGTSKPLLFRPGTSFHYAHTNLVILGEALQKITGQSVARMMQLRIMNRLRLRNTQIPSTPEIQQPVQHAFDRERGVFEDSTYFSPSWASHSGVITSNVYDVAAFQRALGSGKLVSRAAFAQQLAPTNAGNRPMRPDLYYGMGVLVAKTWIIQHAQVSGYDVVMGYLPSRDLTIVVSTAIGVNTKVKKSSAVTIFYDAAAFLAPDHPLPAQM